MNKLAFLENISTIARNGINLSDNTFDKERYEQILHLCNVAYQDETGIDKEKINRIFNNEIGYITPKVGVNGIIFNEDDQVLLELRTDDNSWCIPGGWADMGESPQTCVIRELKEETGFDIKIVDLVDLYWRIPYQDYPFTSYHIAYLCEIVSGSIKVSHESHDVAFKSINEVEKWHRDHKTWVEDALKMK